MMMMMMTMMMMLCIQTCQVCCKSRLVTTYLMLTLKVFEASVGFISKLDGKLNLTETLSGLGCLENK